MWDPPIKNPQTVELYRVFWRPVESSTKQLQKGDTAETQFEITNLKGKNSSSNYYEMLFHPKLMKAPNSQQKEFLVERCILNNDQINLWRHVSLTITNHHQNNNQNS